MGTRQKTRWARFKRNDASAEYENLNVREEDRGKDIKLTMTRKFMLCAALWGIEAANNFTQLYTLPAQQMLGMPLALATLTGIISGPPTVLLLPWLGWLTDRGSNPHGRKTLAPILATATLVTAIVCILVADFIHLNQLHERPNVTCANAFTSLTGSGFAACENETGSRIVEVGNGFGDRGNNFENCSKVLDKLGDTLNMNHSCTVDQTPSISFKVPFKAGLVMFGFIILDVGYDAFSLFTKSYALACSPAAEHTFLLAVGLMVSSCGGLTTALLGMVDLSSLSGLSAMESDGLAIQMMVQAVMIIGFLALGLPITLLTGRAQRLQKTQAGTKHDYNNIETRITADSQPNHGPVTQSNAETRLDGNSLRTEETVGAEADTDSQKEGGPGALVNIGHYGTVKSLSTTPQPRILDTEASEPLLGKEEKPSSKKILRCCQWSVRVRILLITLSTALSLAMTAMFSMGISDYVAKAIYKGQPDADPGTESLARYHEGVQRASRGFSVHYGIYFLFNFVHPRILAYLGYRVEFLLVQLLMASSMVILALTARMEAFYLLAVVSGVHRASNQLLPSAAVAHIVQTAEPNSRQMGFALSMVTAASPMGYCVFFSCTGWLEHLTGLVSIPLWIGTFCGVLAAFVFLLVGKIE